MGREGLKGGAAGEVSPIPTNMRAVLTTTYGGPEVARLGEIPVLSPGPKELLVKIHASTVNRTDCAYRAGAPRIARAVYGLTAPNSKVLGCEFAAQVVEAGDEAKGEFSVGDHIFGYVEGQESGGHAEYMVVPADGSIARIPDGVSFESAAAATEGAHYALAMMRRAGVGSGTKVLVNGATGSIGSAAVQLCVAAGAEVTAVCGGQHIQVVRRMGAARVIDYETEDFTALDMEEAFDVVLDAVGKSTFGKCRRLMKANGIYTSSELGPWWQNPFLALVTLWFPWRRLIFPIPVHDKAMVEYFASLQVQGKYKPLIDREYRMEHIIEAYTYVESGRKIGNVILKVCTR